MLVLTIAEDLNELLEDGRVAAMAPLGKLSRVMEVTVDFALVLIIRILSTEYCRTYRAREVFDVIFAVQRRNVGATKSATTLVAEQIQSSKVIGLAKRILATAIRRINREKLGRDNITTILYRTWSVHERPLILIQPHAKRPTYLTLETFQVKSPTQSSNKLAGQWLIAFLAYPR